MNTNARKEGRPRATKGVGSYFSGILQCLAGGLLVIVFGVLLLNELLYYPDPASTLLQMVFLMAGCFLLYRGLHKTKLYKFGQQVRDTVDGKTRESLALLSQVTHRDLTTLVRGLREVSANGMFPGAYVDLNRREFVAIPGGTQPPIVAGETQLKEKVKRSAMPIYAIGIVFLVYGLTLPLYRLSDFVIVSAVALIAFLVTARFTPKRTVIVEARREVEPVRPPEKIATGDEALDEVLTAAMEHMNELARLRAAISNQRIDKPLSEIEHVCKQIFDYIKKTPQKVRQIRQFMNYYLPTTIRLLKNYEELSREPVKGDTIKSTMEKIEDTMQTILKAFQKELDDLYKDKAMDISVDIEVLKNMMEQEGLDGDSILQIHKKEA